MDLLNLLLGTKLGMACLYTIASVTLYFLVWRSERVKKICEINSNPRVAKTLFYLYEKFLGGILFGIIPLVVLKVSIYDTALFQGMTIKWWAITISLSLVPFVLNYFMANNKEHLSIYPQLRLEIWDTPIVVLNSLGWCVYLLGYEIMFRGVLFYSVLLETNGEHLWLLVILNTLFYAAAHIPKGLKEVLAALPFGVLLCWLTVWSGSLLSVVVIHIFVALSNDIFSVYHHPKFKYKL